MFNTKLPLYLIFIIFSIICGLLVVYKNSKNLGFKKEEKIGLLAYVVLGSIFGGKYFSFFTDYKKYNGIFNFLKVGLSSYGAVLGILLILFIFSKQFKKNFKELVYIHLPAIPLMYGIGKIGCFLAGCCYGIEYSGIFSVTYNYSYSAPHGIKVFPIQLVETIVYIIIFIYIYNKVKEKKVNNKIIGETLIICGIPKFLLEYLRMSHVGKIITVNQIVSILFIILGMFLVFSEFKIKQGKK